MFDWLFKPKQKDPLEMLELLLESLSTLSRITHLSCMEKPKKHAAKSLHHLKIFLTASAINKGEHSSDKDNGSDSEKNERLARHELMAILVNEALRAGILEALSGQLWKLDFETRKDAVTVFSCILRRQVGSFYPAVQALMEDKQDIVINNVLSGLEIPEMALFYGKMLRELVAFELILERVLQNNATIKLFEYARLPTFDIASDATASLKVPRNILIILGSAFKVSQQINFIPNAAPPVHFQAFKLDGHL
jgi:hypothetical protein